MEIKNKVEYIDINKLTLLENNPRQISKDNFEKIASFGKISLLNNKKDKKPLVSENLFFHKAEIQKIK